MTEKLFFNICASLINLTYKKRRCNFNMCTFLHIKIRAANESEDEAKARSCRRRLFLQRFTFFFPEVGQVQRSRTRRRFHVFPL